MKILVSPGYGAGWSTWNYDSRVAKYMLTYQPIIDFLESGNKFSENDSRGPWNDESWMPHPILQKLQEDCLKKFGESYVCILGARDLEVVNVSGQFVVREYDGNEYVSYRDEIDWMDADE